MMDDDRPTPNTEARQHIAAVAAAADQQADRRASKPRKPHRHPIRRADKRVADPAKLAEQQANQRRRAALEADRTRFAELCQFHQRHKNHEQLYIAAWKKLSHVDQLILAGELTGRW